MCIETKRLKISISFAFSVFLALAANIAEGRTYLLTLLFSFLHELTHIFFLFLYGVKKAELHFSPGGIKMTCVDLEALSYRKTVICSLSAPAVNILTGAVFFILGRIYPSELMLTASYINLIIGTVNLLPLSFLDGGRGLNAALLRFLTPDKVYRISDVLSVFTLIFLASVFFIFLLMKKFHLFLLIFFAYCTCEIIICRSLTDKL